MHLSSTPYTQYSSRKGIYYICTWTSNTSCVGDSWRVLGWMGVLSVRIGPSHQHPTVLSFQHHHFHRHHHVFHCWTQEDSSHMKTIVVYFLLILRQWIRCLTFSDKGNKLRVVMFALRMLKIPWWLKMAKNRQQPCQNGKLETSFPHTYSHIKDTADTQNGILATVFMHCCEILPHESRLHWWVLPWKRDWSTYDVILML